jgi:hypothetical protein
MRDLVADLQRALEMRQQTGQNLLVAAAERVRLGSTHQVDQIALAIRARDHAAEAVQIVARGDVLAAEHGAFMIARQGSER